MMNIEFTFHASYEPMVGTKIKVIKGLRYATMIGLREAKLLVEKAISDEVRIRMTEAQFGKFTATLIIDNVSINGHGGPAFYITKLVALPAGDDGVTDLTSG